MVDEDAYKVTIEQSKPESSNPEQGKKRSLDQPYNLIAEIESLMSETMLEVHQIALKTVEREESVKKIDEMLRLVVSMNNQMTLLTNSIEVIGKNSTEQTKIHQANSNSFSDIAAVLKATQEANVKANDETNDAKDKAVEIAQGKGMVPTDTMKDIIKLIVYAFLAVVGTILLLAVLWGLWVTHLEGSVETPLGKATVNQVKKQAVENKLKNEEQDEQIEHVQGDVSDIQDEIKK